MVDPTRELRESYLTLYGAGAMHAAAGLLRDVLESVADFETIPGRSLLVLMMGPDVDVDGLLERFREGQAFPVESLLPLLSVPGIDPNRYVR